MSLWVDWLRHRGFGVIHPGDTFSGSATWDTSAVGANPAFPNFSLLTGFQLTTPTSEGLSVTAIPSSQVSFAGAFYSGSTFGYLQINDRSTVDNNFYIFFLAYPPNCSGSPSLCNADITNAAFTVTTFATSYATSSLTAVPEPGTAFTALGLLALSLCARARRQTREPRSRHR